MKKRGDLGGKRAQVSIFLLAAVIILILGMIYFFYQRQSSEKKIEYVQPELVPLKTYVEGCLKQITDDGLETIGLTGGYIDIPDSVSGNPKSYLAAYPSSHFKIPYWWYGGMEAVPTEDFIKDELKVHIKRELGDCIKNFEPFESRFIISKPKEPMIDIQFNDADTSVSMKYPLEVLGKGSGFKASIGTFQYGSSVRFKKVYELAKTIMERENKDYFLEKKTIDLYSMDTEVPTTDVEVTCKTRIWQLNNINGELKKLLRFNLPYIRIQGTDYNPDLYVPQPDGKETFSQSYYNYHYVWEIDQNPGKKYNNIKVSFNYDDWPIQIYARPSQNGVLKSNADKGTDLLKFFCLKVWHFTYDIDYPVLATIFDQQTDRNRQYQFNFPFRVHIDHNQPERLNRGTASFNVIDDLSDDEYCNDAENDLTIFTVNNATGDDLKDVNLTFTCGRYSCDMGQSQYLSLGAAAGATKKLPYCVNGIVKGTKVGYSDAQSFVQTNTNGKSYLLFMNPLKEISDYKVVKHQLSNPNTIEELSQAEQASIYIKSNQTGYESFVFYPKEGDFPLKLPAGKDVTYEVAIYLVDGDNLIGGYSGTWKVGKDDLNNAQQAIFHVVYQGSATEDERALFISGLDSYSKNIPQPELK